MTIADYVILGGIVLSALIGLFRGFFKEALSLATWIIAAYLSYRFGPYLSVMLEEEITTGSVRLASSYTIIFIVVLVIGALINYLVGKLVKKSGLAGTDKILGLVFGGLRGVLIVLVFILLARMTVVHKDPWYQASKMIGYFTPLAEQLRAAMPATMNEYLEQNGTEKKPASPEPDKTAKPQESS